VVKPTLVVVVGAVARTRPVVELVAPLTVAAEAVVVVPLQAQPVPVVSEAKVRPVARLRAVQPLPAEYIRLVAQVVLAVLRLLRPEASVQLPVAEEAAAETSPILAVTVVPVLL
jgi:hypothetical protein